MQVTGQQLSEELLELLPDYELAWSQHDDGDAIGDEAGGGGGGGAEGNGSTAAAAAAGGGGGGYSSGFSAFYRTASTMQLSVEYGDLMYKIRDLEVRGSDGGGWCAWWA